MDYIVVFVLGMVASGLILKLVIRRAIDRILDQMNLESTDSVQSSDIELKLEFDQNTYFTYNTANNQFVCQGSSVQQLRERLSEMFPGQTTTIVEGDPAILAAMQQELEQTK